MKIRLDNLLFQRKLVASRSQAESYIRMGKVFVREEDGASARKILRQAQDDKTRHSARIYPSQKPVAMKILQQTQDDNAGHGNLTAKSQGKTKSEINEKNSIENSAKNPTKNPPENSWRKVTKPGYFVDENVEIKLEQDEQFVSRAALKLKSVAEKLNLDFRGKIVLDIGSSTGGFTEFALTRGARKVIAVDVGTDQLHPKLRDPKNDFSGKIELHEKTDIRSFYIEHDDDSSRNIFPKSDLPQKMSYTTSRRENRPGDELLGRNRNIHFSPTNLANDLEKSFAEETLFPDIILADVSFISLREILPHVAQNLADKNTQIIAMVKPQFETGYDKHFKNRGVIKNEKERREILHKFELWTRSIFLIKNKKDSEIAGSKGNRERFYLLQKL